MTDEPIALEQWRLILNQQYREPDKLDEIKWEWPQETWFQRKLKMQRDSEICPQALPANR